MRRVFKKLTIWAQAKSHYDDNDKNCVCLVTGASRGIGRGIALELGTHGATVYITGRTLKPKNALNEKNGGSFEETAAEINARGGICIPIEVDHSDDNQVTNLFSRIRLEQNGRLDVLVNNAFSAAGFITSHRGKGYWDLGPNELASTAWDEVNRVGLRNHYLCAVLATRMMLEYRDQLNDKKSSSSDETRPGLIVNISSFGGLRYLFNVAYGVGKSAMDRMAVDMATELNLQGKTGVAVISLWPGIVRTEHMKQFAKDQPNMQFNLENCSESPELTGRVIAALAQESRPQMLSRSGHILLVADTALSLNIRDVDGQLPQSIRSISLLLKMSGWKLMASFFPSFLRLPYCAFASAGNKF